MNVQPHVVRFKECFLTADYLAIAMEYAAGGDMYKYTIQKCVLPAGSRCLVCESGKHFAGYAVVTQSL